MLFAREKSTGLIPQESDSRDFVYKEKKVSGVLKTGVDLRDRFPVVTDQNGYQSCTYHAVCALLDYELKYFKKHVSWDMNTSEAFLWYYGRKRLGKEKENSGTILRDAFKVIKEYGFVTQNRWDYKDGIYTEPNPWCKEMGLIHKNYIGQLYGYFSITSGNTKSIVNSLDNLHPVAFGMYTDKNYQKLNKVNPYAVKVAGTSGAHAQLIVGYKFVDDVLYFIVRNSYGQRWADNGYSYISEEDLKTNSFNLWCLQL
jgi:C1A family cysteine protease